MPNKYREYFDIDEEYFPQVNDSTIAAASPDFWSRTYPHQTFIEMLTSMERVLARQEMRSLWIEGAYGTGKSQCAFALKKILEVPESELRKYWDRYEPLKNKTDLLEKILGHKQKGIVTAYRYASGGINSPRDLFMAVQDSIKAALIEKGLYTGDNTLKDSAIAWIEEAEHKLFFDALLKKPEWKALFSQSTADEVLSSLRKGGEVKKLMDNIFRLADKEGITALNIDSDRLLAWLRDIIDQNNIKIVFIWDEFSDYFRNNRESLTDFQRIAELVNLKPFFFVVVTHESGQLFTTADDTWKKVRDRFIRAQITLPDNIAFNLIGEALNVKPAAKGDWDIMADDLNGRVTASRAAVMKETGIQDPKVMKKIMPLHPMAALLLKNIAAAFQSNQRSMFDFIKTANRDDVKAFQWFIENLGPMDDHPLLTVNMLWNFFYEKGKENLTSDIRLILDTYPQQQNLREDERAVLKAILIMQAIDQRTGGTIELFKATEQNLSYVFEGISSGLDVTCKGIAKQLKDKGILVANPLSGGRYAYAAAVLAGDQAKIDKNKKDVRQSSTTSKLVTEGGLSTVLSLSPALRLRFETEPNTGKITPVTIGDFTRTINGMRDIPADWHFNAVIAFAKDDTEALSFRKLIKEATTNQQYKNIVFIDALSTPLGLEAYEQYVDYSAMAMYYTGNNNTSARESSDKARHVLDQDWKNRIYNGPFIVYTYANPEGEKLGNAQGVVSVLQTIVTKRFQHVFDFTKNLSENQMKLTNAGAAALCGITQNTSGIVVGVEKHVLPAVWHVDKYWEVSGKESLDISKIKIAVEKRITNAFDKDGQISIGDVYDFLQDEYGFAPCNLSAFITGFLLKEYGYEPYRYSDSNGGHDVMTPDKLKEMIGNYIGRSPKPSYIVKMTNEERAFYELTEKAWHITPNTCSSVSQAVITISSKMRGLGLPVWCLAEIDNNGAFDMVQKYIDLVQKEGMEAHRIAVEIGKIVLAKPTLVDRLPALLTGDNCQAGIREYLKTFEGGRVLSLAGEIGAQSTLISDIKALFTVKYSCLWDKQTGEDEIRKLLVEYSIARESNILLNTVAHSRMEAFKEWRDRLKFIGVSCEALKAKYPSLSFVLDILFKICRQQEILPEQLKSFLIDITTNTDDIRNLLHDEKSIFAQVYAPYLSDLKDKEIEEVKSMLATGMFEFSATECNAKVKATAEDFRRNQLKTQMYALWKEKTGTKNPMEWSNRYKTPILCCVSDIEFEAAKKAFDTLNRSWSPDNEVKSAIAFLQSTRTFEDLSDDSKRNDAFKQSIIGKYSTLLVNAEKVREALEHLTIEPYDWRGNPSVQNKVKQLAEAEYNAGGSDKALTKIDQMDDSQLKQYLKRMVKENITVGIEIIGGE